MAIERRQRLDEVWTGEYERDGDTLTRRLVQPDRDKILEAVKKIRQEGIVEDRPLRGRWCLSIPFEDWETLRRHSVWKDLHSVDNATSQAAWRRFLVHSDSEIYRVRQNAS